MTLASTPPRTSPPGAAFRTTLWTTQAALAAIFVGGGIWKLVTPIEDAAATFPWAGEVPSVVFLGTAVLDVLGGLGVLLPSLTRIRPGLTVLAALGCGALQVGAVVFHVSRGEGGDVGINVVLLAVAAFIAWGRRSRAPIAARS